ncbi:hypothetical protein CN684_07540 [Bacillus wiedmannii]|uniref:Restriction endonuclease type II EcoRII C-terminal domain-containing protein n=1 Tax=Bacillus wiedmannii TaxID=1890302 RepID=A0A2C4HBW7_9BACI|nr:hypothetical protein CN684_07540 [Bacillus wiedmannii]PHC64067.1 hypothetical protein COF35_23915 [Bacillus wiedmannii]
MDTKQLLTLESRISENRTTEMQSSNLRLVLPQPFYEIYSTSQQIWLMDFRGF